MESAAHKPDISGFVYFDSVGMKVNVLNTKFFVHDSVHIVNNHLLFRNFYMKDIHGQQAVLNGEYQFWENRVKEVAGQEILYTLGMRGVHDGKMQGAKTVEEQKAVLNRVFVDQRGLLEKYVNKDGGRLRLSGETELFH